MRTKVDFGIDLGTTNSAIARMVDGVPVIIKTEIMKDTLPSCVSFSRKQDVIVGDSALNANNNDRLKALKSFEEGQTNTFLEFKRTMGTTHRYAAANTKRDYSSEEFSAEVLKKLKSVVTDENIHSIVITVPAKFLNPQNEGTMAAAKLAGFKRIELLQEPVAAAIAYGLNAKNKNGYWLVFDFGGGTFDAALIKAEEGILTVKDTDGDNWLGGKNLDEAIVDHIFIPYLQENYKIDFILESQEKRQILRSALKPFAEQTKNALSFKSTHNWLPQMDDIVFEDEDGVQPEIDIDVTEGDLVSTFEPLFQRSIDISQNLLSRNNLKGSDLGALILVGGPTFSPILRRMLREQITEKVDTSADPMTVVAKGAALFASTIEVTEEQKEESRDKTKLQLDIKCESTTTDMDEMVNVKVLKEKTSGNYPDKIFVEFVRSDGGWSSGKKIIGEKASIIDVNLSEGRVNNFEIVVYNEIGDRLECEPSQFSILQGIGGVEGMQVLPYHIGIGRYFDSEEKDLFFPAKGLDKNKKVPATGVINGLKTRRTVRPGMAEDVIRIPIYQGDHDAMGTNPVLNNLITEVIITGEHLPALLPEGSDVDITIKVDKSQLMKFVAYFPLLDHTEELDVEIKQTEPPSAELLLKELSKAKLIAQKIRSNDVLSTLVDLENQLENERGSADGRMKILDALRKELLTLDKAERLAEWPTVEQDLKKAFYDFEELIKKIKVNGAGENLNMDMVEAHLLEYRSSVEHIIRDKNTKEAKTVTNDIRSLDFEMRNVLTGNAMDVQYLQHLQGSFGSYHWKDQNKARTLCTQGMQMAASGQTSSIRAILIQLIALMPDDEKPKDTLR